MGTVNDQPSCGSGLNIWTCGACQEWDSIRADQSFGSTWVHQHIAASTNESVSHNFLFVDG